MWCSSMRIALCMCVSAALCASCGAGSASVRGDPVATEHEIDRDGVVVSPTGRLTIDQSDPSNPCYSITSISNGVSWIANCIQGGGQAMSTPLEVVSRHVFDDHLFSIIRLNDGVSLKRIEVESNHVISAVEETWYLIEYAEPHPGSATLILEVAGVGEIRCRAVMPTPDCW